jgi:hypothetical protein
METGVWGDETIELVGRWVCPNGRRDRMVEAAVPDDLADPPSAANLIRLVVAIQDQVAGAIGARQGGPLARSALGGQFPGFGEAFGHVHEFLVEPLGGPAEYVECFTGGQVSPLHQDAFGLTDDVAGAQRGV